MQAHDLVNEDAQLLDRHKDVARAALASVFFSVRKREDAGQLELPYPTTLP